MKRTLVSLLTLLTLSGLSVFTSCQKETTGDGTQFSATMESRDGKTVLNGTALNWVSGDQVVIYGTAGCGFYQATPQTPATVAILYNMGGTTGNGPFRAFYPTSLTDDGTTITLPAAQTYVEGSINEFPMYAESATNQLAFRNLCGVLKLHLTKANTNITTISITANAPINGNFTISNIYGEPVLFYAGNGTNTVVLSCSTPQAIDNGKDFYITLPATFDSLKSIELNTDDGRYCIKTVKNNVCINVQRNTVTEIEFGENDMNFIEPLPEGALSGLFTINANGGQVRFSQGNLQYQASTDTWRFAEHQYDTVGWANRNISAAYSGWIDLFGWGTGNNPTLASTNNSDYGTFVDWGVNAISNGGGEPNTWRTLTRSEWNYLRYTRTGAVSKCGPAIVNGVPGLVYLPDSWTLPGGCMFNAGGVNIWTTNNSYTLSQWAEMEAAGAVFLPAAGTRLGANVGDNGGGYWSSTPYNSAYGAFYMSFTEYGAGTYTSDRDQGRSVRLVRDNN